MSAHTRTWAALQLTSGDDVERNLARVEELARRARERGASLVVLPENFALMGDDAQKRSLAEAVPEPSSQRGDLGPVLARLARLARELGVWVAAGGFPERSTDEARPFNTFVALTPEGTLAAKYRKLHLFDVDLADGSSYRESESTSAGDEPVVVELDGVKTGLSICYDVRFPELYRELSREGAEALLVPAAFTLLTGKDHWEVLLRARAIENQCFVVAAAQWGRHPRGRQTFGKSMAIDPWGVAMATASEGEGMALTELDLRYARQVRSTLPALTHRRR
jgi:predicted amidohydrolase